MYSYVCYRLVMNLMTINIVSCLTLFPAIMWDLNLMSSSSQQQEPLTDLLTNNASMSTTASVSVCIWSTLSSSLVAHTSLLAMLTIGKIFWFWDKRDLLFEIKTFEIRTFEIWTFEIRTFEIWTFEIQTFEIQTFEIQTFETWTFEIWTFEIRTFEIQTF